MCCGITTWFGAAVLLLFSDASLPSCASLSPATILSALSRMVILTRHTSLCPLLSPYPCGRPSPPPPLALHPYASPS